jgi:MFS transporter, PPP family, 3-phenylpropionic acid transporter
MTSLATRLSALHAASFLAFGIYLPFFPVWLGSRGLDSSAIGAIVAIPMAVRVLVTTPLMALADGPLGSRRVLVASHAALAVSFAALLLAPGPLAIAAIVAAMAVAQAPVIPLNDLVTMQAVRERPDLDYGAIRVWGSIAFLLASVGGGAVSAAADPNVVVLLLAGLPGLGILATLAALPRAGAPRPYPGTAKPTRPGRIGRSLWLVMAAAACIQASHGALYAFGSLHWRSLGFSEPAIGTLWAFGVVAEITLFSALGRTARTSSGALRLMGLGAVAAGARWLSLALTTSLAWTFAFQALHALSFAATHIGALALVSGLAPEDARGRAQGWMSTLIASATALSAVGSGVLFRAVGPLAFAAMAPLAITGLLLMIAAARSVELRLAPGAPGRS